MKEGRLGKPPQIPLGTPHLPLFFSAVDLSLSSSHFVEFVS